MSLEVHIDFYEDNKKLESLSWVHAMSPSCYKCKTELNAMDVQIILRRILYSIQHNEAYHSHCILPLKGIQL